MTGQSDAPTPEELLAALKEADHVLRRIYVRTGDLAAARAHDAAFEVTCRADVARRQKSGGAT